MLLIAVAVAVLTAAVTLIRARTRGNTAPTPASAPQTTQLRGLVAGPGRVEPRSEDIKLGSELSGKLKTVNVEEGYEIRRGQVLAELENDDYRAQVMSAAADLKAKDATLRKVLNGARQQERLEAWASAQAARAVADNAIVEMERRQKLYAAGVISREEFERYSREYNVAHEKYREAAEHHSLVDDRAREEDITLAEADLQLARARLEEARARYAKTLIRSPIDGTVLRKHHRTGESVSNSSTVPDPILTVGDKKVVRVRVDVDETEVSKVQLGQKAYVTADAFPNQKFWGRVVQIGEQLGRKNVRTDEPTERVDTKILETLLELDAGASLPMGLRVDAYIVADPAALAERVNPPLPR
jgi:HlyD family secretion protein